MRKKKMLALAGGILLCSSVALAEGGKAQWGYIGDTGPENWGTLDPAFRMCAEGKNQSPVDLRGFVESELEPLKFAYRAGSTEILNNGHAIQVNYAPGSTLKVGGHQFELKQIHFHAPSESTIEGRSFPMEAHLVHADREGNLAVVAVMYEEGDANARMAELWKKMPAQKGQRNALAAGSVEELMPKNRDYYRFNGSLTTPPCSEGVRWLVLKTPVEVSKEQVEEFERVMRHPTNRPLQPINARPILK